jgi:hypothetical protein
MSLDDKQILRLNSYHVQSSLLVLNSVSIASSSNPIIDASVPIDAANLAAFLHMNCSSDLFKALTEAMTQVNNANFEQLTAAIKQVNNADPSPARSDQRDISGAMFQVGDHVRVVNRGSSYTSYDAWFSQIGFDMTNYTYTEASAPDIGVYTVICLGKHKNLGYRRMLYGIAMSSSVYIIGEEGLEKA